MANFISDPYWLRRFMSVRPGKLKNLVNIPNSVSIILQIWHVRGLHMRFWQITEGNCTEKCDDQ